jgi:hypothetical protein
MTVYEFNSLDEMEQAEAVGDGVFIGDRKDSEHREFLGIISYGSLNSILLILEFA